MTFSGKISFPSKVPRFLHVLFDEVVKHSHLHFDNQSLQAVFLVLIAVFSKRNRKHVLCVAIELEKHS